MSYFTDVYDCDLPFWAICVLSDSLLVDEKPIYITRRKRSSGCFSFSGKWSCQPCGVGGTHSDPSGSISISSVYMVSWFEIITGLLITKVLASEALLTNALEDFLDTALVRMNVLQGTISSPMGRDLSDS